MVNRTLIPFLTVALLLAACAAPDTLPRHLPTMREVYDAHLAGPTGQTTAADRPLSNAANLAGYTRTAYNEIENLFPMLPNPTLVMYIDPHLSESGHPVPGYATAFTLYERPHFALPGEAPPPTHAQLAGRR